MPALVTLFSDESDLHSAHPGVDLSRDEFLRLSPGERLLLRAVLADVAEAVREERRLLGVHDDHVEDGAPVRTDLMKSRRFQTVSHSHSQ